jgi:hypothetical protein
MKWKLALSSTLMAGYLVTAAYAQQGARSDQYCRDMPLDRGSVMICEAYTYQQCMASRVANERCFLNPRYSRR